MKYKCNIIGAGTVGKNIAHALYSEGIASLQSVCNRQVEVAAEWCQDLGKGFAVQHIKELPYADITWITTNDNAIKQVVESLQKYPVLKPDSIVIHCSGVLNASILEPLKAQGCHIASLHPLKAFRPGHVSPAAFNNVDCIIEGDEEACSWLHHTFTQLGAQVYSIDSKAKAAYHAAACIASNYLLTLAAASEHLLVNAGFSQKQALSLITKLMQGNVNNLQETSSINHALTGPIMRGDYDTIALHLDALKDPLTKNLYKAAGLATLSLVEVSEEARQRIHDFLSK